MISVLLNYIMAYIKVMILHTPFLYYGVHFLMRFLGKGGQYPTYRDTDLCVEAYPSSANSFLFVLLERHFKQLKIAHHTHAVASLKQAKRYGIPVIVVIRRPQDAIASRMVRFKKSLTLCLLEYIWFYRYVLNNRDNVIVLTFEDVTENPLYALRTICERTDLDVNDGMSDNVVPALVLEEINRHYLSLGRPDRAATPSETREYQKEIVKALVKSHRLFKDAYEIYRHLVGA